MMRRLSLCLVVLLACAALAAIPLSARPIAADSSEPSAPASRLPYDGPGSAARLPDPAPATGGVRAAGSDFVFEWSHLEPVMNLQTCT